VLLHQHGQDLSFRGRRHPFRLKDVLDRRALERELRVRSLQLPVLGLQLPQPLQLVGRRPGVFGPLVKVGRLLMLCCRRISATGPAASPCFKMPTIRLSVNRDSRMGISLAPESLPSNGLPAGEAYEMAKTSYVEYDGEIAHVYSAEAGPSRSC
jgi:hypothetical protein